MAIAAGANSSASTEPGLQANWHFLCAVRLALAPFAAGTIDVVDAGLLLGVVQCKCET